MKLVITHPLEDDFIISKVEQDVRPEGSLFYSLDVPHCHNGSTLLLTDDDDKAIGEPQKSDGLVVYVVPTREGQTRTVAQRYVGAILAVCFAAVLLTFTSCLCYVMVMQTILKYSAL